MLQETLTPVALFELVLLIMGLVIPLEIVARRLHLPPAAALILAGMGLALLPGRRQIPLDPDLMLVLFLPPLLMSSAFMTVWRDFRANLSLIAALAIGAVAFTTLVVGVVAHWMVPTLPWAACFTLGAIVSPPDALAAKAVLQRVSLPPRLLVLLEGESLVNDASGLVLFRIAVTAVLTGSFSVGEALLSFTILSVGGVAVGIVLGWSATRLLSRLREPHLVVVGSLLTAWSSYVVADRIGVSGVLSTVACGLVLGSKQHAAFGALVRTHARAVWEVVDFVLESLVFVLIGLALRSVVPRLSDTIAPLLPAMVAVVATVVLSRFAWMFATAYGRNLVLGRWRTAPPLAIPVVMGWAGMRGVVSLAIALSLPTDLPGRDFILLTTFVVILVTVLLQGSTLAPLIRLMRLGGTAAAPSKLKTEIEARLAIAEAQLGVVRAMAYDGAGALQHPRLLEQFEYRFDVMQRVSATEGGMPQARVEHFNVVVATVTAGRAELLRLHRDGEIHDTVLRALEMELDLEELGALRRRGDVSA